MALAGIAYSCMVVSSFSRAQSRVLQLGYADDTNTHTMISGMIIEHFLAINVLYIIFAIYHRSLVVSIFVRKFCRTNNCRMLGSDRGIPSDHFGILWTLFTNDPD